MTPADQKAGPSESAHKWTEEQRLIRGLLVAIRPAHRQAVEDGHECDRECVVVRAQEYLYAATGAIL